VRKSGQGRRKHPNLNASPYLAADVEIDIAGLGPTVFRQEEAGHAALISGQFVAAVGGQVAPLTAGTVPVPGARRADTGVVARETTSGRTIAVLIEPGAVAVKGAVAET
jgi:hypothetical protein